MLICFSIITFFVKDEIKEHLIISGISLIISLYIIEGYLTFKKQFPKEQFLKEQFSKEQLYKKQTGKKWDTRNILEVYKDFK